MTSRRARPMKPSTTGGTSMSRYHPEHIALSRGTVTYIDKRRGVWRLVDRATRIVLDYGYIKRTGWSFYLNAGRN